MSAQLEYPRQPAHARDRHPVLAAPLAPVRQLKSDPALAPAPTQSQDPAPARPDGDRGMSLLFAFFGAMAIMVGDVVLVSAVDRWWILIPAAGVLLLMTFVVLADIMRLLAES
jgi:hypothetical protein